MFDLEADNLLDEATLIHVLCYQMQEGKAGDIKGEDKDRLIKFFNWHIESRVPVVAQNGILYDIPLVEKLLKVDLSKLMVIDTLYLSWYLNPDREVHGLASFLGDYGIEKPEITSWVDQSYEDYKHRATEDVKINKALWEDFKERLVDMYSRAKYCIDNGMVDGTRTSPDEVCYIDQYKQISKVDDYIDRILTFLMFKADTARLREKTMWEIDVPALDSLIEELDSVWTVAKNELEKVLPEIPQYSKRTKPKKPYKKDQTLSAAGEGWNKLMEDLGKVDERGNALVLMKEDGNAEALASYEAPNANSTQQIKDWLYSHGWVPTSFEYKKDKEATQKWAEGGFRKVDKPEVRKIPQVSIKGDNGKELCPSVKLLAEKVPEVLLYDKYTTVKHRLDMVLGYKENLYQGKYLRARVGGITNTFRDAHREIVNVPGVQSSYGERIRSLFIAGLGKVSFGADLSSLEDRVKHNFMLPHDPEYVATMMADDYDPHILMALTANMVSQAEFDNFKQGVVSSNAKVGRRLGKITNYAAVYNSGAETLARSSGMSLQQAKTLLDAYWKLNWSVKAIAEEQCVITCGKKHKWLINPINGFCYQLRKDSDRFSTLCQGTGSFFFDMWVDKILDGMEAAFKVRRLTANFHDEFVVAFTDNEFARNKMKQITYDAIDFVSEKYKLRRKLGCEGKFGYAYAQIH